MRKNLLAMLLAVVMIAAVVFIAAPATKAADANVITAQTDGEEIPAAAGDTVDIAGKKNVKITVTGEGAIYLVDSANLEDLTGAASGTATVNGAVADWVQHSDGFKYLAVKDGDTYSAHPFNFTIDKYGVNTHYSAISARVTVIADDTVAALIDAGEFGLRNYTLGESTDADKQAKEYSAHWEKFGDKNGIRGYFYLEDSLTSDVLTANASCELGAYVKINGKIINSLQTIEITPQAILTDLNNKADTYSIKQKVKMNTMMNLEDNAHLVTYCENFLPRDISTDALTDEEIAELAALATEQYDAAGSEAANLSGFATWAYSQANVDVSAYINLGVWDMMKGIFSGDGTTGRTPILQDTSKSGNSSYNANYSNMLVDGYYGGTHIMTEDKLLTAEDFQVGDLFCGVYYPDPNSDSKNYYAGMYLGEGKFLMTNNAGGWHAVDTEVVFSDTIAEELAIYYVLRPSQLVVQESGLRKAEEDALSKITKEELAAAQDPAGKTLTAHNQIIKWFYMHTNLTYNNGDSHFNTITQMKNGVFTMSGTWTEKANASSITGTYEKYNQQYMDGYYGGVKFGSTGKVFTADDFEIGDLFCAQNTDSTYAVALYQGEGKFLMWNNGVCSEVTTEICGNAKIVSSYNYYYVLRPGKRIGA